MISVKESREKSLKHCPSLIFTEYWLRDLYPLRIQNIIKCLKTNEINIAGLVVLLLIEEPSEFEYEYHFHHQIMDFEGIPLKAFFVFDKHFYCSLRWLPKAMPSKLHKIHLPELTFFCHCLQLKKANLCGRELIQFLWINLIVYFYMRETS